MKLLPIGLLLISSFATAIASAGDPNEARWFRYYDDKKQASVTDMVTPEHVARGYDELTASMRLIRHVEPKRALTPQELVAAKAKQEADTLRAKADKQLLRLYSAPADAEQEQKRQVSAIQVHIDFSASSLESLRKRRAAEAQRAATFERTGKPVPKDIKDGISTYDKQIAAAQTEMSKRKAEQDKVKADFAPVIQRLTELLPSKAATAAPAAPKTN